MWQFQSVFVKIRPLGMNGVDLQIPKVTLGSRIGGLSQKLWCYIHLSSPIDFEVPEVEKASCSDVNADKTSVQHTYGEHSPER